MAQSYSELSCHAMLRHFVRFLRPCVNVFKNKKIIWVKKAARGQNPGFRLGQTKYSLTQWLSSSRFLGAKNCENLTLL